LTCYVYSEVRQVWRLGFEVVTQFHVVQTDERSIFNYRAVESRRRSYQRAGRSLVRNYRVPSVRSGITVLVEASVRVVQVVTPCTSKEHVQSPLAIHEAVIETEFAFRKTVT
jgi:hypothetical protein